MGIFDINRDQTALVTEGVFEGSFLSEGFVPSIYHSVAGFKVFYPRRDKASTKKNKLPGPFRKLPYGRNVCSWGDVVVDR